MLAVETVENESKKKEIKFILHWFLTPIRAERIREDGCSEQRADGWPLYSTQALEAHITSYETPLGNTQWAEDGRRIRAGNSE